MIFEGASKTACSRPVQAKDPPAWTLMSCLVQPWGCNPVGKKAAQTKKAKVNRFRELRRKEEKSSTETVRLLTFEAI